MRADLCVVILTYNEELHIERAIRSVSAVAREIFVIDSFSTDTTVQIAIASGATVVQHEFINQALQFQWALENLDIKAGWILRLDADEVIEPPLASEISLSLQDMPDDVVGINLRRKHIFLGRWIRHGGRYPLFLLRIWRRDHGRVENRWMDEHVIVSGGRTVTFKEPFADINLNNLSFFTDKHNGYATREAVEVLNQRLQLFHRDEGILAGSSHRQTAIKRLLKEKVFNAIPFQVSAILYFVYRYVFQMGFLDGREGLIYHFLQGFWYRFLVGAKVYELSRGIEHLGDVSEIRHELSRLTGLKV